MALTPRQKALYRHTVSLYAPQAVTVGALNAAQDLVYPSTPTKSNVPCYLFSTPETDEPRPPGRMETVNIFTLDEFHFEATLVIQDTWLIKLTTPGHPDAGGFWFVLGNPQTKVSMGNRRANYRMVKAKRGAAPPGVT